ncbi:cytochrome B [Mucilaginibacter conchicola]|uniref:Cytochrome B n=1 Tax=Mucilaginibacter conchicola TaxID=2303333 RepID=A0A372NT29_9SPHI|nr:cytochrome B [Mucilaginibacter conchicola]RFZ92440.1 cytochrome B [Mucilaginibacter conchicola]
MNAYKFFLEFHSGFRYIVVLLVLAAIFTAFAGLLGKKPYTEGNRKLNLFALISAHTQLLIGIVLYFLSPFVRFGGGVMKDPDARYWTVEHLAMMIFAIVLITIGHSKSKKASLPSEKHRVIALFYLLAFITVVVAILQSHRPFFGMSH